MHGQWQTQIMSEYLTGVNADYEGWFRSVCVATLISGKEVITSYFKAQMYISGWK
jgi:hypothetical protein